MPRKRPAARPAVARRPVVTVVGSASPVSTLQARRLARDPANILVQMAWRREPAPRDIPAVRRMGRLVAQAAPRVHYVLTGGETARAVLGARNIRALRLLGEVEPGVPFGMAPDGTLVCTKAGAFGRPGTLAKLRGAAETRDEEAMTLPVVGITMGDPAGVGPEVIMKALARAEAYALCRPLVIGDARQLARAKRF